MAETLPEPQMRWELAGTRFARQRVFHDIVENGKKYEYEYQSKNLTAAKRMKTRTEKWCQKYVKNNVHKGYEIIIRPYYRQNDLWHVVYCRWTDED